MPLLVKCCIMSDDEVEGDDDFDEDDIDEGWEEDLDDDGNE